MSLVSVGHTPLTRVPFGRTDISRDLCCVLVRRLSGTSGLASNPANRQIDSSSGASAENHKKKNLDFFIFFFLKNLKNMI